MANPSLELGSRFSDYGVEKNMEAVKYDSKNFMELVSTELMSAEQYKLIKGEMFGKPDASGEKVTQDKINTYFEGLGGDEFGKDIFEKGKSSLLKDAKEANANPEAYWKKYAKAYDENKGNKKRLVTKVKDDKITELTAEKEKSSLSEISYKDAIAAGVFPKFDMEDVVLRALLIWETQDKAGRMKDLKKNASKSGAVRRRTTLQSQVKLYKVIGKKTEYDLGSSEMSPESAETTPKLNKSLKNRAIGAVSTQAYSAKLERSETQWRTTWQVLAKQYLNLQDKGRLYNEFPTATEKSNDVGGVLDALVRLNAKGGRKDESSTFDSKQFKKDLEERFGTEIIYGTHGVFNMLLALSRANKEMALQEKAARAEIKDPKELEAALKELREKTLYDIQVGKGKMKKHRFSRLDTTALKDGEVKDAKEQAKKDILDKFSDEMDKVLPEVEKATGIKITKDVRRAIEKNAKAVEIFGQYGQSIKSIMHVELVKGKIVFPNKGGEYSNPQLAALKAKALLIQLATDKKKEAQQKAAAEPAKPQPAPLYSKVPPERKKLDDAGRVRLQKIKEDLNKADSEKVALERSIIDGEKELANLDPKSQKSVELKAELESKKKELADIKVKIEAAKKAISDFEKEYEAPKPLSDQEKEVLRKATERKEKEARRKEAEREEKEVKDAKEKKEKWYKDFNTFLGENRHELVSQMVTVIEERGGMFKFGFPEAKKTYDYKIDMQSVAFLAVPDAMASKMDLWATVITAKGTSLKHISTINVDFKNVKKFITDVKAAKTKWKTFGDEPVVPAEKPAPAKPTAKPAPAPAVGLPAQPTPDKAKAAPAPASKPVEAQEPLPAGMSVEAPKDFEEAKKQVKDVFNKLVLAGYNEEAWGWSGVGSFQVTRKNNNLGDITYYISSEAGDQYAPDPISKKVHFKIKRGSFEVMAVTQKELMQQIEEIIGPKAPKAAPAPALTPTPEVARKPLLSEGLSDMELNKSEMETAKKEMETISGRLEKDGIKVYGKVEEDVEGRDSFRMAIKGEDYRVTAFLNDKNKIIFEVIKEKGSKLSSYSTPKKLADYLASLNVK